MQIPSKTLDRFSKFVALATTIACLLLVSSACSTPPPPVVTATPTTAVAANEPATVTAAPFIPTVTPFVPTATEPASPTSVSPTATPSVATTTEPASPTPFVPTPTPSIIGPTPATSGSLIPASSGPTFYLDGAAGNDDNPGTSAAPWKSLKKAFAGLRSGDTLVIAAGIYHPGFSPLNFGPAGHPGALTTFRAAPGARVIITSSDDAAMPMNMADYVLVEGLWLGGTYNPRNPAAFVMGHEGDVLIGNTFYGWVEGPLCGWCENFLIQDNRFVNSGADVHSHAMYISSGTGKTANRTNHVIVDHNIIIGGSGYGLHSWHQPSTLIWTRNFVSGSAWGGADDGSYALWANNFFWKETGGAMGHNSAWGPLIGPNQVVLNNVFGPGGAPFVNNSFQLSLTFDRNVWSDAQPSPGTGGNPRGANIMSLASGQELAQLGISAGDLDAAIAQLQQAFNQPSRALLADSTVEPNFARIRSLAVPSSSPLYQTGHPWFGSPVNIGPDSPIPSTIAGFWTAYSQLGLLQCDRYDNCH